MRLEWEKKKTAGDLIDHQFGINPFVIHHPTHITYYFRHSEKTKSISSTTFGVESNNLCFFSSLASFLYADIMASSAKVVVASYELMIIANIVAVVLVLAGDAPELACGGNFTAVQITDFVNKIEWKYASEFAVEAVFLAQGFAIFKTLLRKVIGKVSMPLSVTRFTLSTPMHVYL